MKLTRFLPFLFAVACWAQSTPPSGAPGALNPGVTQANVAKTICKSGWTKTVRPPASFTNKLKLKQMADLGLAGTSKDYEEDHRVPLELGGNPTDEKNLWPEPWARPYGAHEKDRLENALKRDVCHGALSLTGARAVFLGDWWPEYKRRYGSAR